VNVEEILEQDIMEEDNLGDRYLTFQLDEEIYGIDLKYVKEIVGMQAITAIPDTPDYIRGIINLRGKIIPVMDVRLRFMKELKEYNERTCVIVVNVDDQSTGLIVDSVSEVISIPESDIVDPPEMGKEGNNFIKGIGKVGNEVKLLLNCERLLSYKDMD